MLSGPGCQAFPFVICYEAYDNMNNLTGIQQGVSKMPTMPACYSHLPIGVSLVPIITITGLSSNKYVSSIFIQITVENIPILVENIVKP